jgi:hypothetical protein
MVKDLDNMDRRAVATAQGKLEYEKSQKLQFIISLLAYPIFGLPILDIKALGFIFFAFLMLFVEGIITGPIYVWVAGKRASFSDDDAFNNWYEQHAFSLALHLVLGILPAAIFKTIWG